MILGDLDSLKRSGIQPNRRVLFITHGYLESGHKNWIKVSRSSAFWALALVATEGARS